MKKYKRLDLDNLTPYLMVMPALIMVLAVSIYPSLRTMQMSFFDVYLLRPEQPFVGLDNFRRFFDDFTNIRILINTLLWSLSSVSIGMTMALTISIQLNKRFRGRGVFRALYLAPWVTPPVVVAAIWRLLLNRDLSPISGFLMKLNLIERPIPFLSDPTIYLGFLSKPMAWLIVINLWSFLPFAIVMFLSGLQTIPDELYEAATVDGASKSQKFRHITLPLLLPVMETIILLQAIWQFNNFNLSFLVTGGGPLNTTELMAVRVYKESMTSFRYGYGAAISVIMMLVVLIPSLVYIKKVNKNHSTSGV